MFFKNKIVSKVSNNYPIFLFSMNVYITLDQTDRYHQQDWD